MTKRKWIIWGVVTAICLSVVIAAIYINNFAFQVFATVMGYVPVFLGIAFKDDSPRKP